MFTLSRTVVDEIMDGPNVAPSAHALALAGLRRINSISNTAHRMAKPIVQAARTANLSRLTLIDLACGGGDVSTQIVKIAASHSIHIDLTLLDRSQTALQIAADNAKIAGVNATTICSDLANDHDTGRYDVAICSLFLHHLQEPTQVIALLTRMRQIATRQVVISDLRRGNFGLIAAWIGGRILSRSPIVHFDAPASVRAAWTIQELQSFAHSAGMHDAQIRRSWPWRMLLNWESK